MNELKESEEFRQAYSRLWKAIFLVDTDEMARVCASWGIKDFDFFASIQLMRPFSRDNVALNGNPTPEQVQEMQARAKERVRSLLGDTQLIPRELIFVGRSMNIVRANNKELGSPVNRVKILAMQAVQANRMHLSFLQRIGFACQMMLISLSYYSTQLWANVNRFLGRSAGGFEDALEVQMKHTFDSQFGGFGSTGAARATLAPQ